jgi:hypothetical protein
MIKTLSDIYQGPDEEENIQFKYLNLRMRHNQPFSKFYTRFFHLAGIANIPRSEMKRDLPEKITTELQRALLPMLHSFRNYQSIAEQCTRLDQGLRRIAAKEVKTRAPYGVRKALKIAKDNQILTAQPSPFPPGVFPISR